MKLQRKNKVLLLLLSFFVLSSCSTQITQEIYEDGTSTITIVSELENEIDYCTNFERDLKFYDTSCNQNGNLLTVQGTYYLDPEELEYEKGLFSSSYTYDMRSLYPLMNSLVNLQSPGTIIDSSEELDVSISITMPGSYGEHSFLETDGAVLFSKSQFDSSRNKELTSKVFHIIPIVLTILIIIILSGISIIVFKKIRNGSLALSTPTQQPTQQIETQQQGEISVEEQKCRAYVLQFKTQYSKETLFQGLVNSGIPQDRAQYYINKYIN